MAYRQEQYQRAYVLHLRPYRDNARLVNLLTENDGHVSAVVYTSSSGKNSKLGSLQPFSLLQVSLQGAGSLPILNKIERAEKSLNLQSQYLYSGFYLNELLVRLLPENISLDCLFADYHRTLLAFTQQNTLEPLLRQFELALLEELGLGLDFSTLESSLAEPEPTQQAVSLTHPIQWYCYHKEQGFLLASANAKMAVYNGQHLLAIAHGNLTEGDVLLTCKRLMRQVLFELLGGKPLNSRRLFASAFKQ
ncbi:DNA repair protein RecO [Thalassotalea maritima]|uniref:DNA repair protein RecO n=1 Tax=Thalassotalea maritima TaxID=3242416 RepID=UPI003528FD0A